MTVRVLIVAIDDAAPLGPQLRAARAVLEWKTVAALAGEHYSLRHLQRIEQMSQIRDRQTVQHCTMMTAQVLTAGALGHDLPFPGTLWANLHPASGNYGLAQRADAEQRREQCSGGGGPPATGSANRP